MPKINSKEIQNQEIIKTPRGLNYLRLDTLDIENKNNLGLIEYIKSGGVILSKLNSDFKFFDELKFLKFKNLLNESKEFNKACVWKDGIPKKLYLERINSKNLNSIEFKIFETLLNAKKSLIQTAEKLCEGIPILRIEDIVYPSETIGRELHLDRHDKTRSHQNYRSIKFFLNLSPSSCRIWGVGPSRPQLIDRLNDYCLSNKFEIPEYEKMSEKKYKLPDWMNSFNNEKRLNHPISELNSVLNNIFLNDYDKKGNFDLVYYNPNFMIIGDSKQVAHKPVYGTIGISIDVVYKDKDIPKGFNNSDEINIKEIINLETKHIQSSLIQKDLKKLDSTKIKIFKNIYQKITKSTRLLKKKIKSIVSNLKIF